MDLLSIGWCLTQRLVWWAPSVWPFCKYGKQSKFFTFSSCNKSYVGAKEPGLRRYRRPYQNGKDCIQPPNHLVSNLSRRFLSTTAACKDYQINDHDTLTPNQSPISQSLNSFHGVWVIWAVLEVKPTTGSERGEIENPEVSIIQERTAG